MKRFKLSTEVLFSEDAIDALLEARIELLPEDIPRMLDENLRKEIVDKLKRYGFTYITLDLEGYRTGSMNEVLV